MKTKIISFAVWGDQKLYNQGLLENIELAKKYYPGWICRINIAQDSPIIHQLPNHQCQFTPFKPIIVDGKYSWKNIFRRYMPISDERSDIVIFRDADSRISSKEAAAVNQWLETDKALHVMHDLMEHYRFPICSGMWGIRRNWNPWLPNFEEMLEKWVKCHGFTEDCNKELAIDELFLRDVIWPMFKYGNYIGHGMNDTKETGVTVWGDNEHPFPPHEPMEFGRYVGQVIPFQEELPKLPKFFFFRK